MASLMENLIEVLEKESGEYENLLALSTRKTPVFPPPATPHWISPLGNISALWTAMTGLNWICTSI